ncbi:DUF1543 domain-containing protein [Mucilaginibacter sp. HMF5004]|uniref:DUF1543 domain-containing protein n=1 Tax=Mucilaginibacter rivuli TaxID=2857527 RepID=UPI001C6030FD|nr:DUF1543 domain-containing protein [Mucilaginibacter rivuli]MBW4890185.1 DUF1543 domain-containing protein [Mucilaginibacter rivuli]
MGELKLYMLLLGCRPPGRHVEQHDFFFGIAPSLKALIPDIKYFWPENKGNIHIDAWREVTAVNGYKVDVVKQTPANQTQTLFFINLGGYLPEKFEEQHYTLLTVQPSLASVTKYAKETDFYQHNHFGNAVSHIDDKYGIDVDDVFKIQDILPAFQKTLYHIQLTPAESLVEDEIHLGYLPLGKIE